MKSVPEKNSFLALTGSLNFLGHGVLPQAGLIVNHLHQAVGNQADSSLVATNKCLVELKALSLKLRILVQKNSHTSYHAFFDAR